MSRSLPVCASEQVAKKMAQEYSEHIAKFYEDEEVQMATGAEAKVGDIVMCSVNGNWSDPCDIGIVRRVAKGTKLSKGHVDGDTADVYVETYTRVKKRKAKKNL